MHPPPYPADALLRVSEQNAMPVVSFLSGWSYPNEKLCLSSPDASVRDRAVDRISDYVGQAAALGSMIVVGLMQGLRADEPDPEKANDRIAEALGRVGRVAERR